MGLTFPNILAAVGTGTLEISTLINGVWRPPQWDASNEQVPLVMTATNPQTQQTTAYVFDVIIKNDHSQEVEVTQNPVQTGAAITDNAFVIPPKLTAEIIMSDAMQAFTLGQWANAPSKSVSAFETLQSIQASLIPVQISTRLRSYDNMMITHVRAEETARTKYGLRAWVTFQQIFTATVSITNLSSSSNSNINSAIPQSTLNTNGGQVQTIPVTPAIQQNNNIDHTAPQ